MLAVIIYSDKENIKFTYILKGSAKMKRIFSIILAIALSAALTLTSAAYRNNVGNHEENIGYDIPKAMCAPTIDGKITSPGEWAGALERVLDSSNITDGLLGEHDSFEGASIYYMWNEAGLYIYADITDSSFPSKMGSKDASGDDAAYICEGLHLMIYTDDALTGIILGSLFHMSLIPTDGASTPFIGDRFSAGFMSYTYDPAGAVIASTVTESGYTLEALIPASVFSSANITEGTTLPISAYVYDRDENGEDHLYRDSTWYDAVDSNKYTLTDTPAGITENDMDETSTDSTTGEVEPDDVTTTSSGLVIAVAAAIIVIGTAVVILVIKKKKA